MDAKAHDIVPVDEWRGDKVRSRLCVGQLKAEQQRDDMSAGTPEAFIKIYSIIREVLEGFLILDTSVAFMHVGTDDEIYVKNKHLEMYDRVDTDDWKPQSTGHEKRVHSGKTFQLET